MKISWVITSVNVQPLIRETTAKQRLLALLKTVLRSLMGNNAMKSATTMLVITMVLAVRSARSPGRAAPT